MVTLNMNQEPGRGWKGNTGAGSSVCVQAEWSSFLLFFLFELEIFNEVKHRITTDMNLSYGSFQGNLCLSWEVEQHN